MLAGTHSKEQQQVTGSQKRNTKEWQPNESLRPSGAPQVSPSLIRLSLTLPLSQSHALNLVAHQAAIAMATLSQLRLATATSQPRNAATHLTRRFVSWQPSLGFLRGGVRRLCTTKPGALRREVLARMSKSNVVVGECVEEEGEGMLRRLPLKGVEVLGAAAGVFLGGCGSAHAVIKDEVEEMMRFSPEAWINIYLTTGVWLVLYFLVIPLVIYNYLRLRWYKRTFAETYFQFLLVFIFFPGLLLLAPFINFRRLPNDGAEEP